MASETPFSTLVADFTSELDLHPRLEVHDHEKSTRALGSMIHNMFRLINTYPSAQG